MKILFASDSFKGSLTSERIVELLDEVTKQVFPEAVTEGMLVADGGEGTMAAVVKECHGSYREMEVVGPMSDQVKASYGLLPGSRAIIEMAEASGLPMVPQEKRNPMQATSFGTGMLIRDALDQGIRDITIAIGGSATNDGGMGAMSALGVQFLDENKKILQGCGADLSRVRSVDLSKLHPAIADASFIVMCDVTNPLLGQDGATYTFGRQKGADSHMQEDLEEGMENYALVVEAAVGKKASKMSGAGAAGGLGFALMTFLNAELKPGIEVVLDMLHFDEKLKDADLVITGEGRMDWQSSFGKVPSGIGRRCRSAGVPAVAIVGGLLDGYQKIYENGICSVVTTVNGVMELEEAIARSEQLYKDAAFRILSAIKCGMKMNPRIKSNEIA
jgi:glycerate kinase